MISLPTRCSRSSAPSQKMRVVVAVIRVAEGGDVVGQRVHPHVEDVAGLLGHGDAPLHARAADAEVLAGPARMTASTSLRRPVGLDAEAIGADLPPRATPRRRRGGRSSSPPPSTRRAARGRGRGCRAASARPRLEGLAARAVPARVRCRGRSRGPAGRLRLPQLATRARRHAALVRSVGGADEAVVGDVERVPEVAGTRPRSGRSSAPGARRPSRARCARCSARARRCR